MSVARGCGEWDRHWDRHWDRGGEDAFDFQLSTAVPSTWGTLLPLLSFYVTTHLLRPFRLSDLGLQLIQLFLSLSPAFSMETRAAKRRRLQADQDALSSTPPCLLPHLHSVRHCLHPFLSATDAARLMRTSRSIITDLLFDYALADHVFTYRSVADAKRSFVFFARYHMRILRLCLPADWDEPLVDSATGRSVLPATLVALTIGDEQTMARGKCVAFAAFDGGHLPELESDGEEDAAEEGKDEFHRRTRRVERGSGLHVLQYESCEGAFDQPIPPGALPRSLRFLQLGSHFDQPLQAGSIPDGVEVLHFGWSFDQPLQAGHLPASLTHLVFGQYYDQPLLPGALPAGLRLLRLSANFNHPLLPGVLPSTLQQVSFGRCYHQPLSPGVIPSSVTHLRLSDKFIQRLQPGIIPEGVVHLHLGVCFDHPLRPGVLPTSLRELVMSGSGNSDLLPGSLPDGLQALIFPTCADFQRSLQPGVIPASVSVVSMNDRYIADLVAGGIPATVRWLQLPHSYACQDLSGVLSPATRVRYWAKRF